ncbi:branched-chain amino acid ABC transporter permease [Bacillus badius]|uniref:High-affinity branched-chain amino acid transport system permease protein LivH n=1 Tax=Bacillus badius TaxID=1455 RepID=A0ABR5AQE3_BACBA|nr:branched-chain amino acid ABC transporter permease [Bacillus badius]KIL72197.1 High-affinity branched-chain amino acid transport system permease protein LivH [Bacillus badius]KIL76961.1 High-affinity branched-chain amino acid transport system permease protein LivH [Bacillus badius]KZN98119.1 ABC transporter permease [Bacillus badius]KZR58175.1 ABC transporter permease [Bacillus badius]MED0665382.1 branched-chain amino acid ABC transporter permease [Bacillus badius]
MELTSQFIQLIFSGLTIGSIYALVAIGFVITYNITGVLNFAQGDFAMLGAMLAITFVSMDMPMGLGIILSIGIVVLVGGIFERTAIYPARNASLPTLIIITLGVAIAIRGFAILIWGTQPRSLPPFTENNPINVLNAVLLPQSIWAVGISLVSLIAMHYFFNKTFIGKAVTACVVNRSAARLMGIKPEWMSFISIAVSAGLGAIAGIIIAPISGATYEMGLMIGMKAFVAAVIGGLTNAPAAIIGAFMIGILESFTEGLWTSGYKDAISFALLLIVLFFMPNGLFAKASGKRV